MAELFLHVPATGGLHNWGMTIAGEDNVTKRYTAEELWFRGERSGQ